MTEETPRSCLSCGVVYPHHEDFLCGECAAPEKIVVTCACGRRCELKPKSPACAILAEQIGLEIVAGMAIHLSGCPSCGHDSMKRPVVFRLKEASS